MGGRVIELDAYRPHRSGFARCGWCGREWVAVVPENREEGPLECPSCHLMTGWLQEIDSTGGTTK